MANLKLDVGYYDPLSVFEGGFREDFVARSELPQLSFKSPFNKTPLQINNLGLSFNDEVPATFNDPHPYLKFMFIVSQNVDDYRSTARPLIKQWLKSVKDLSPSIPLFIVLFEHTHSKLATDKLLKTSIEGKLKKDFSNLEFPNLNIFRIKSIYSSNDEKLATWGSIKECIKSNLSQSIWNKLDLYAENEKSRARVFTELEMYDQASHCYETLFNKINYIKADEGFRDFKLSNVNSIFDPSSLKDLYNTKFDEKLAYFKYQSFILLNSNLLTNQINSNITKLIKLLLNFINSLEMNGKRYEFSWLLINEFLNLPLLKSIINLPKNDKPEVQIALTSLMFLKRNELLKLGHIKSYHLQGAFVELSLNDEHYEIETGELLAILKSFKTFAHEILKESKLIIERYKQFDENMYGVASLEAETALILHYNSNDIDDYSDDEILKYLYEAFQHFSKSGWDNISLPLLDVYLKHLEKQATNESNTSKNIFTVEKLLGSYMKLISLNPKTFNQVRLNSYLDLFFDNKQNDSNLTLNIPALINLTNISSLYCSDVDTFALDITLESPIDGMEINDVVIELSAIDNSDAVLYFSWSGRENGKLKPISNFTVTSLVFVKGVYRVTNVFATISSKNNSDVIISHEYSVDLAKKVFIYYIPMFSLADGTIFNNTHVSVSVPSIRWLHKDLLEFNVKFGDLKTEVKDCVFTFFKVEPDRVVPNADYHLHLGEKSISFDLIGDEDKLIFNTNDQIFNSGDHLSLKLPFFFPADITNTKLSLYFSFKYTPNTKNAISSIQYQSSQLSTQLKLAASADEKVKFQSLISHYTLNSILPNSPICIHNVSLKAEKSIIEKWKIPKDVIVFMDQGSTFFFKITELNDKKVDLKIEYSCLWSEIVEFVATSFTTKLIESRNFDLIRYSGIVKEIWEGIEFKVNYYALTGCVCPNEFQITKFNNQLEHICDLDKKRLITEVSSHVESVLDLSRETSKKEFLKIKDSIKQELWIPVQLPTIDIIGTLEYQYEKSLQYLVGEPILTSVQLTINSFSTSNPNISRNMIDNLEDDFERKVRFDDSELDTSKNNIISLFIEFVEDDQNWMIGGVKDVTIDIESINGYSKSFNFDLIFIPIKTGKIELPDVKLKLPTSSKLSVHLDFKNKSEIVTVVNEVNTVTQLH